MVRLHKKQINKNKTQSKKYKDGRKEKVGKYIMKHGCKCDL